MRIGLHPRPQTQDARLNLSYRVDDEVSEDKDQQQADGCHGTAHPPELPGQSGDGETYPIHVLINPAAGNHFELLVGIVKQL